MSGYTPDLCDLILAELSESEWRDASTVWKRIDCWSRETVKRYLLHLHERGSILRKRIDRPNSGANVYKYAYRLP